MIIDRIFIENNNVHIIGNRNGDYPYRNWIELQEILKKLMREDLYEKVEITKKVQHEDEFKYSYIKSDDYVSQFGMIGYHAKVLVEKQMKTILVSALRYNNYIKVKKGKTLSLK
jgi:hypothetical protein